MADQAISLEFDTSKVQAFLRRLQENKKDVLKADDSFVSTISMFVFQDVISHFEKERGSEGKWKAWSKVYRAHMESIGKGGNKILQDTGRLRQSFTPGQWRSRPGGIEWYNPAKTKSGFPYAAAHDRGGPKLPKRDFMWLSDKAMDKIAKATAAFLAGD